MNKNGWHTAKNLGVPNVFSSRNGGVSCEQFSSLNLGFTYGDKLENVIDNWKTLSNECGISINKLAIANQVHKSDVAIITSKDTFDNGMADDKTGWAPRAIGDFDGLVTADKGTTLSIFTADCACVLLSDTDAGVVAALHCGWKPLVADIIKVGIDKMVSLGAHTNSIQAAIGPCIGKCCFEVGEEVIKKLTNLLGEEAKNCYTQNVGCSNANEENNKFHMDLSKSVETRLTQVGIPPKNITSVDSCTCCNTDLYFSYRAEEGNTGRLAGVIECV